MKHFLIICVLVWVNSLFAQTDFSEKKPHRVIDSIEYQPAMAGEAADTELFGLQIKLEEKDRTKISAFTIGYFLNDALEAEDSDYTAYAAFYLTRGWEENERRLRAILAGVINFVSFYDSTWNSYGVEFIATWENYTLPISSVLEIDGEEVEGSDIYWGHLRGGLGLGWRSPLSPWEVDNYFSIHLLYEPGLLYFDDTKDTANNFVLPRTTYEDRFHLQIRFDMMRRNVMEMLHEGFAGGADAIVGRRHNWDDHDFNGSFTKDDTQDYEFFSGYLFWAGGIPFLSQRHRLIIGFHGGISATDSLDRYSAPRLGGGPSGDETESLSSSPIPGARFDEFLVSRFALFSVEYRLEVLFFLYLHFKAVGGEVRKAELIQDEVSITENEFVGSLSIGLTSGFFWNSQLHFEYVNDQGVLGREDQDGHNFLVSWSKSF